MGRRLSATQLRKGSHAPLMDTTKDFEQVVQEYTNFVYNVAYKMMGHPEDAEEVAQEAFLSAFRHWDSFRGEAGISTWLYRITVNAALMRLRKEKRARYLTATGIDDLQIPGWGLNEDPERAAVNTELKELLEEGIAHLPPDLRSAVVLSDAQELSNAEAATILDISVAALKARLHRGRVLLRKYLEQHLQTSPSR